jgi:SNF2-related domain
METREVTRMANRIRAAHRWAVTGTPLGPHCLADLYGLLQVRR